MSKGEITLTYTITCAACEKLEKIEAINIDEAENKAYDLGWRLQLGFPTVWLCSMCYKGKE
jgi:hypothetical protein